MAKLEDRGQRGLPPPPAPTRRGANPWKLSDTARKHEAPAQPEAWPAKVLEELLAGTPPAEAQPGPAPEPPGRREPQAIGRTRKRSGFLPLIVLLIIAGVVIKIAAGARETGEWRELIPALFILFFIAHAWWRSRQRREEHKDGDGGA